MGGPQLEGLNTKDSATHDTSDHFVARGDIGWKPYLSFFARHEAAVKVLRGLRHRQAHGGFGQKFFFFLFCYFLGQFRVTVDVVTVYVPSVGRPP